MLQLDLFGTPIDTPSKEKEEVSPVVKKAPSLPQLTEDVSVDFAIKQHSILEEKEILPEEIIEHKKVSKPLEQETPQNPIFFTDGKIGVKVKVKGEMKPEPKPSVKEEITAAEKPAIAVKKQAEKIKLAPQKRGRKSIKEMDSEVDLIEVPDDEELLKKQYYPIREVAKWFNVNTSLLRFWENEFDILKPRKNRKGDRMFRPEDVKNIHLIYQLLRQRKYTIEGAKEYLKANKKQADTEMQLINTLHQLKSFLLDLKANLQ